MKYLIIAITLITSLSLNAQTDNNFKLDEGKVLWQKVYETTKSKEELINHFKHCGLFFLFRVEDGKIIATLRQQKIDIAETGVAGLPAILTKTDYKGSVIMDLKEGKYRVTMKDILLVGTGGLIKKGEKQKFEKHYVNKDGKDFRKFFKGKTDAIYNTHFNALFELEQEKKDDW